MVRRPSQFRPELDELPHGLPLDTLNAWHRALIDRLLVIEEAISLKGRGRWGAAAGSPGHRAPGEKDEFLLKRKLARVLADAPNDQPVDELADELVDVMIHHAKI